MKNRFLFTAFILIFSMQAFTQGVRLNAYTLGVFNDKVDSYYDATSYYNGTIKGGFVWGGGIEYMMHDDYGIEVLYMRQDTKAPMTYYNGGIKNTNFDLAINHIMLGGNKYFRQPKSKLEPFGGAMLGIDAMTLKNPDNGNKTNKTFFAWCIKGGANIWASEKVGIKLQAQLLSAVQSIGGGFYFGTGGSGAGVATYSSMLQFGLGGGLVFKLGNHIK